MKHLPRLKLTLLTRFSLVSFLLTAAIAIALAWGLQRQLEQSALRQEAEAAAYQVANILNPNLEVSDLAGPIDPVRYARIDALIRQYLLGQHIVRVKIWSRDGLLLYSDAKDLVGRRFPTSEELEQALAGEIVMEVSSLAKEENVAEQGRYARLLEVYVPLRPTGSPEVVGAYEIYRSLDVLEPGLGEMRLFVWASVGLGFLILYGSLFTLVRNASRELVRRNEESARLYEEARQRLAERERAEAGLRASEARSRGLLESAPDAVVIVNADGQIVSVNAQTETLFGYRREELLNQSIEILVPERFRERHAEHHARFASAPQARFMGTGLGKHGRRKDGSEFFADIALGPLEVDGELAVLSLVRDITERRRAEETLRKLSSAVEQTADSVVITDPDGVIQYVNPAFERHTGYARAEAIGQTPRLLKSGRHSHEFYEKLWQTILSGQAYRAELMNQKKNGELYYEEKTITPIKDTQGNITHFVATGKEVTERKRAEQELQRRADEFAALYEISRDLSMQHDLPALLEIIVERAMALLKVATGAIYLYDTARGDLVLVVTHGLPLSPGIRLRPDEGAAGYVAQTRQPLIVDDYRTWEGRSPKYEGVPFTAVLQVPMLYSGELIGVLSLTEIETTPPSSVTAARKYSEADARLLSLFAAQAASAVQAARRLEENRRRLHELDFLHQTVVAATASPTLDQALERIVTAVGAMFRSQGLAVFMIDEATRTLVLRAGLGVTEAQVEPLRLALGCGITGWVAQTGQPLLVPDVRLDPRYVEGDPTTRGEVCAPLKIEDRVIGVINVESPTANAFTADDLRLLSTLAGQLTTILERVRLLEEAQQRAAELGALVTIGRRLTGMLDLAAVLASLLEETARIVPGHALAIMLFDAAREELWIEAARGYTGEAWRNFRVPLGEGVTGQAAATRQPALIAEAAADPDWLGVDGMPLSGSEMAVPLVFHDQLIGVMNVESRQPAAFNEHHLRLLTAIADSAATAIASARLFEQTRRRAAELEVLAQVSSALRDARSAEEMLPIFLRQATQVVGAAQGAIFLVESGTGDLVARAFHPPDPALPGLRHHPGEGITGHVAAAGQVRISEDLARDPLAHILPEEAERLNTIRSMISLPLRTRERTIGVMHLGLAEQHAFTEEEVRLLTAIGDIAANALQRAALHEQTERQLQRLAALHAIDRAISASLDLHVTLNVLLDQVTAQLRAAAAGVLLLNPHTQMLEYAAGRGFRTRAMTRSRLRLGE
ncbi:MAG TPA: hypothetical protein DEP84_11900, partial [Chloroflexi bacterium]|nr:hypothetical protein [Chloroflexota bacterium]